MALVQDHDGMSQDPPHPLSLSLYVLPPFLPSAVLFPLRSLFSQLPNHHHFRIIQHCPPPLPLPTGQSAWRVVQRRGLDAGRQGGYNAFDINLTQLGGGSGGGSG